MNWAKNDVMYNPTTSEVENLPVYAGFVAYEHDWKKRFSSTFTYSIIGAVNKSFQEALAFENGYKGLVSLFYVADSHWFISGLTIGAEIEYAQRTNKDNSINSATRGSLLGYYNF